MLFRLSGGTVLRPGKRDQRRGSQHLMENGSTSGLDGAMHLKPMAWLAASGWCSRGRSVNPSQLKAASTSWLLANGSGYDDSNVGGCLSGDSDSKNEGAGNEHCQLPLRFLVRSYFGRWQTSDWLRLRYSMCRSSRHTRMCSCRSDRRWFHSSSRKRLTCTHTCRCRSIHRYYSLHLSLSSTEQHSQSFSKQSRRLHSVSHALLAQVWENRRSVPSI